MFIDDSTSSVTVEAPVLIPLSNIPGGILVDGGGGDRNADLTPIFVDVLLGVTIVEPPIISEADTFGDNADAVRSVAMLGNVMSLSPSPLTHSPSSYI